jgi:hypothetical protein
MVQRTFASQMHHLLTYDFFKDAVVWFPEQRIIIVVDNTIEFIKDHDKSTLMIQGEKELVTFYPNFPTVDRYNKIIAEFFDIDPYQSSKGYQNYRRWFYDSQAYNIAAILCSSYGYRHFVVSNSYFLNRKKEYELRRVNELDRQAIKGVI